VAALALLATPWDFWAESPARAQTLAGLLPALEPLMAATGTLPVDALQLLFAVLDPFAVAERFRAFGRQDPTDARAIRLVALEDWLNDGVPLAAPVARECLAGWYGRNTPATGAWRIAGEAVDPARLACPAFLAVPARDRIVPPPAALALHRRLPPGAARLHQAEAGHVGMAAGRRAEATLWRPLRDWIGAL
jgi:poly(3-hydroxyalkanoate) synthetase